MDRIKTDGIDELYDTVQVVWSVLEAPTVAKHLIVSQLSVFGVEDAKFKVDWALKKWDCRQWRCAWEHVTQNTKRENLEHLRGLDVVLTTVSDWWVVRFYQLQ